MPDVTRRGQMRILLATAWQYRRAGWRDAVQVQLRWISCPLWEVERRVPLSGRILEVGCGRGLLSAYLASAAHAREVVGVDVDEAKILTAARVGEVVRRSGARVRFERCTRTVLPEGPFDAVVFAEMLYLLEPSERRAVIERAVDRLSNDATVVVKEVDAAPRWKDLVNRFGTWVDMRVLRNLEGDTVVNVGPDFYEDLLGGLGFTCTTTRLDRGYPFAHFVVVGRRVG